MQNINFLLWILLIIFIKMKNDNKKLFVFDKDLV